MFRAWLAFSVIERLVELRAHQYRATRQRRDTADPCDDLAGLLARGGNTIALGVDVHRPAGRIYLQNRFGGYSGTKNKRCGMARRRYATLEDAGKPHRGKTTDAEKEIVRNNLDKINKRLKRDGMRTIRLDDPEMVSRYGLEALVEEVERSQR